MGCCATRRASPASCRCRPLPSKCGASWWASRMFLHRPQAHPRRRSGHEVDNQDVQAVERSEVRPRSRLCQHPSGPMRGPPGGDPYPPMARSATTKSTHWPPSCARPCLPTDFPSQRWLDRLRIGELGQFYAGLIVTLGTTPDSLLATRPYGWRRSRSTSRSTEGQKGATSLSVATRWRSASRHFSFEVQLRHLRRSIAKLSSVRGSTIAFRSMPRSSTSAQNSASPECRRVTVSSRSLLSFVIAHDVPNRMRATPAGRLVPEMSINLCRRRPLGQESAARTSRSLTTLQEHTIIAALPLAWPICTPGPCNCFPQANISNAPRDTLIYRNFRERIFVAPASLA
jgi:hypothetical protein